MPPTPKHPSVRQRVNKATTKTTLTVPDAKSVVVPPLPKGKTWHPRTLAHWDKIMRSPMAPEYDDSDLEALYMLADLWDDFYNVEADVDLSSDKKARLRINLASEIRLQEQRFGLTPIDRRRLQWEIDRGEAAEQSTRKRRNEKVVRPVGKDSDVDPRRSLA